MKQLLVLLMALAYASFSFAQRIPTSDSRLLAKQANAAQQPSPAAPQQFAEIGDLKLESGDVIHQCRVGYRTFGELNADSSNAVLLPTWASGVTAQFVGMMGPGHFIDTSKYFVIALDALSNGVSSSPSNSPSQPRMKFPKVTVADMVEAEYRAVTGPLHLKHIHAVLGISMGGMQTFQWMVAHPDFMDVAIPIVGSPRLAPWDLLHWQAEVDSIRQNYAWDKGNYRVNPAREAGAEFGGMLLTTQENYNRVTKREDVLPSIARAKESPGMDANDHLRQAQAMMALDVSRPFGGSLPRAAAAVKAKVLVIVAMQDHAVSPQPALDFAALLHAPVVKLEGDCGHMATSCEAAKMNAAVADFLAAKLPSH